MMNTVSYYCVLCFIICLSHGVGGFQSFLGVLNGVGIDQAYSIHGTSDGGFVLAGLSSSFGVGSIFLSKLSQDCVVQWAKYFGEGGTNERVVSVFEVSDGGIVISGRIGVTAEHDIFLAKFTYEGNAVWLKVLGKEGSYDDLLEEMVPTSDGGFIGTGMNKFGTGGPNIFVSKFDCKGDMTWMINIGEFSKYETGMSLLQSCDGGYIVSGWLEGLGAGGYDIFLTKIDSTGDIMWFKLFGGGANDVPYKIKQLLDGSLVICGNTLSLGAGGSDVFLMKLNSTGGFIWATVVGGTGVEVAFDFEETDSGNFIVVGSEKSRTINEDTLMILFDNEGSLQWARTIQFVNPGHVDILRSIVKLEDGSFGIGGYFGDSATAIVAKVDSQGNGCYNWSSWDDIQEFSWEVQSVDETGTLPFSYVTEDSSVSQDLSSIIDVSDQVSFEFKCFDCDDDYVGLFCNITDCNSILSNDTSNVCSGKGKCQSHDVCVCDASYISGEWCEDDVKEMMLEEDSKLNSIIESLNTTLSEKEQEFTILCVTVDEINSTLHDFELEMLEENLNLMSTIEELNTTLFEKQEEFTLLRTIVEEMNETLFEKELENSLISIMLEEMNETIFELTERLTILETVRETEDSGLKNSLTVMETSLKNYLFSTCDRVNATDPSVCNSHGICIKHDGDSEEGKCFCSEGYIGNECQILAEDSEGNFDDEDEESRSESNTSSVGVSIGAFGMSMFILIVLAFAVFCGCCCLLSICGLVLFGFGSIMFQSLVSTKGEVDSSFQRKDDVDKNEIAENDISQEIELPEASGSDESTDESETRKGSSSSSDDVEDVEGEIVFLNEISPKEYERKDVSEGGVY